MTTQPQSQNRKPTHGLYQVTGQGKAATWTRIGSAWAHKDGEGFNIACDAIPLRGRLVMRAITERAPAEEASA